MNPKRVYRLEFVGAFDLVLDHVEVVEIERDKGSSVGVEAAGLGAFVLHLLHLGRLASVGPAGLAGPFAVGQVVELVGLGGFAVVGQLAFVAQAQQ